MTLSALSFSSSQECPRAKTLTTVGKTNKHHKNEKVFLQWVSLYIGEKVGLEDFQDGVVLNKLMKEIKRLDKLPVHFQVGKNKLQVLGNIANILKYIADQGVRLTCSPEGSLFSFHFLLLFFF